jgi:nitrogen fixation/metabolism regulation signal transduction histidine kinase
MSETQNALRPSRAVRWAVGWGRPSWRPSPWCSFLLTLTTNNRVLYERNYGWLFGVNVVVALLLAVLLWVAVRLLLRLRRGRFGSRLLVKLAAIFALVGLMPGLLIYYVSYQFVSRSIESWFDVKVEGALAAGVSLASATLEMQVSETATRARSLSAQLSQTSDATAGLVLERIRDQLGASDLLLWNAAGQLVASVGQSRYRLDQERPTAQQLRTVVSSVR